MGIAAILSIAVFVLLPASSPDVPDDMSNQPIISNIIEIPISLNQSQISANAPPLSNPPATDIAPFSHNAAFQTSSSLTDTSSSSPPATNEPQHVSINYLFGTRNIENLPSNCEVLPFPEILKIDCGTYDIRIVEPAFPMPNDGSAEIQRLQTQLDVQTAYSEELENQIVGYTQSINEFKTELDTLYEKIDIFRSELQTLFPILG